MMQQKNRIDLVKSGSATFKDTIYYDNANGNYRRLGEDEIYSYWDQDGSNGYVLTQFTDTLNNERAHGNAKIFRSFNSINNIGFTKNNKTVTKYGIKDIFLVNKLDNANGFLSGSLSTIVPSENTNDYTFIYTKNTSTRLDGTGEISNSISNWANTVIGNSQSVFGYATGVLAESSYRGSGNVNRLYAMYARGYNFGGSGIVNYSATIRAESESPIAASNDATMIKNHYGIYNTVNASSLNTGIGDELTGFYTSVRNAGKITYPVMYGIKSTTFINAAATKPTNLYGLYVGDATGAKEKNYAIYTNVGINHFGDRVGIGTPIPQAQLHVKGSVPKGNLGNIIATFDDNTGSYSNIQILKPQYLEKMVQFQ